MGVVIPVTSVECERGISRYSSTKTDSRCGLTVENTDNLLMLALEAKPLSTFNLPRAFELWISMKDRRGYNAMIRQMQQDNPVRQTTAKNLRDDLPLDLSIH